MNKNKSSSENKNTLKRVFLFKPRGFPFPNPVLGGVWLCQATRSGPRRLWSGGCGESARGHAPRGRGIKILSRGVCCQRMA